MPHWDDAPITKAAFAVPEDEGPPPINREWKALCKDRHDAIVVWAGQWNRGHVNLGWTWWSDHLGDAKQTHPAVRTPAANVERMLSPLAHEARIRIMQAMYDGPKTSGQLSEATGMKGGGLYHHLKDLLHAAYVKEVEGGYDLTQLGCQLLITVVSIAGQAVKDRGEEGLLVAADWEKQPEADSR